MLIEFIQAKGCVPAGYVNEYPDEQAQNLIKQGIAKPFEKKVAPVKSTSEIKETK